MTSDRSPVRAAWRIAPGRPALMLGVRTALATAAPLLLAPVIGPAASVWASTGGFTVSLADKGGSYRMRARTMGGVTLGAACAVVAGSLAAPHAWAAAPLMLVVAGLCGFAGVLGPMAVGGATTVAVLFAVSLASPPPSPPMHAALVRGISVAAAGGWSMTLALFFWPVRVYKPARWAIARSFGALAAHARKMAALLPALDGDDGKRRWADEVTRAHGAIRDTLEEARDALAATRRGRLGESRRGARLNVCLQAADQLFGVVVALEEVLEGSPARASAVGTLERLASALELVADRVVVEGKLAPTPAVPFSADELRAAGDAHAAAIVERLRAYVALALETIATLHTDARPPAPSLPPLAQSEALSLGERLRAHLSLDSVLLRHALRVGVTAAIAVSITRALGLSHGYWVTLTVLVLLQPYRHATLQKALQRLAGTLAGAIVAALLLSSLPSPTALLCIATVLAGVSAAVLQLNYALYALFLTPTFVLLAELHARDWHLAEVRIVNTLLGGVLAFAASRLFWPHRERDRFPDEMARVLAALADYVAVAAAVLAEGVPPPAPTLPPSRRRLGLQLNAADASFERVLADGGAPRAAEEPMMTLLLYARRMGATLGAAVSVRTVEPLVVDRAALDAFAGAMTAWLRALAAAIEALAPPPPLPPLETLVQPFAGTLLGARLERLGQQLRVVHDAAARLAGKIAAPRS